MGTKAPTKPSTPRLSEVARHVVVPDGAVSTGWPAVRDKCRDFGVTFRPWQQGAGQIILAKRADGKYAATIGGTGMSIPRQVGKTFLVGAIVFALCLLRPGMTFMWTAHRMRTAEETFGKMQAFAKRRKIAPHVLRIIRGSGEEEIQFRNGSRILFGARERGFGLGFDEVDGLIFDEAQRLSESALDDMVPAANQSRQATGALLLFLGTPPRPTDNGQVFKRMRSEALSGNDSDTGWIEFGADPNCNPTPPPAPLSKADWQQVAKANPSYPHDTPPESILRMRKKLGSESFLREGLGIWDEDGPVIMPGWGACFTPDERPAPLALGVAVSLDHAWGSIAAAGLREDVPHIDAVKRERGDAWLVGELKRIQDETGAVVAINAKGPASDLIDDLLDAGVQLAVADLDAYIDACESLYRRVGEQTITHGHTTELDDAVGVANWREIGERRAFGHKKSAGDISMLEAATLAMWGTAAVSPNLW